MSTTEKTHLPRAYAVASLSALFFSSALLAEPLRDKSQFVRESLVTIPVPFTPFGNRVEFNRYGDDGSKCVLDANGVLTWIDSDGTVRLLPSTSLAVPLFVTNTECLVWNNRFVDYNNYPSRPKAEIKLFRAAPGSTVVTTQSVATQGTEVIDTPPVTTTTGSLTFVTTTRLDDGDGGDPADKRQVDDCDMRVYRVTFDAGVQFVRSLSNKIRGESVVFENTVAGPGATAFGYGSDGSIVVKLPDVGVQDANDIPGEDQYYWFDSQGRSVKLVIPHPPFFNPPTVAESINQVLFTSNTRLVYVDDGDKLWESRRSASTGNLNGFPTPIPLATDGEKVLELANYVRIGDKKYICTLDDSDKKTVRTYLLGSTAVLQSTTVLADAISPNAVTGTINPSDGSALLVDEDSASLIWLHSNGHSLVGTKESKALFVSNEQAVIWENAGAPPNGNGVPPAAVVKHFSRTLADPAVLTPTVVTSTGSNLLNTSRITPDFDNWFFTTSSKPSASTALLTTYQLSSFEISDIDTDGDGLTDYDELNPPPGIPATNPNLVDTDGDGINDFDERTTPSNKDTDGDGLTDDEELALGTNPFDADTDADGISDRKEAFPFYIVEGSFSFPEALVDAARRGGRLVTIESPERLYQIKRGLLERPHPFVVLPLNYDPEVLLNQPLWIGGHDSEVDGRFRWLDQQRNWVTPANELNGPEIGASVFAQMRSGSAQLLNVVNINSLTVGHRVIASGIPVGTTITAINTSSRSVTLSNPVASVFTSNVGNVVVTNGGVGYTIAPTITFNPPGATAVANIANGKITSITVTSSGSYVNPPAVEITGGNGGGAAATAVLTQLGSASIQSISIGNGGTGYTSTPTVVIAGGNAQDAATATATVNGGQVTAITIVNPGSGYTSQPTITLVGGGASIEATATANMFIPAGRIYSPATAETYSNWNTVLPGNRANVPEGIFLNSGTDFRWSSDQFTARYGYVLELPFTDPLKTDTDVDDLNDFDELFVHATDPLNADTDLDGLDDFLEIFSKGTDPLDPDTDRDGLLDGDEVDLGTDPLLIDTDADGFTDFEETDANPPSDPLNPNNRPTGVTPGINELLHSSPELASTQRDVTISDTFAPFGTRPDTDRVSEDGSAAIRDLNGAIIWVDRLGQPNVLPETSLAKTLYVSNSECVVWRNRYDETYNLRGSSSRVVIYRRDASNQIVASPEIVIPGTLLEAVSVSPSTFGFTLIAAETDITNPLNESRQQFQNGSNQFGPTYDIRLVDIWDGRVTTGYRVTFDGKVQELTDRFDFIPRNSNNVQGMRVVGSGADASQFITMTVALDFFDSPLDADPGFYKTQELSIWATWNIDAEQLANVPLFSLTDPVTEIGYISNKRLILETAIIGTGNHNLQDIRVRDTGAVTLVNTVPLAPQTKILALNTFCRAGTPAYLYTTGPLGDSVSLFRFNANLTQIGNTVTLPSRITSGNAFVRNPRDASLLIRDDDGQSVWIPSVLNPLTSLIEGLGTPRVLASQFDSRPLFVSTNEAVIWRNAGAPADLTLPDTGVVPLADISHYALNSNGAVVRTPIAPPILGRFVVRAQSLTLDPDTEGWFITTFEKTAARTALLRTYRLRTGSTSDRDGDGLLDIEEFTLNTDPINPDTDADGITDGQEVYPFYPTTGSFSYEQARQDAIRRGARLAVIDTPEKLAAIQRVLGSLPPGSKYWLGGSDQDGPNDLPNAREGQYRWMDTSARFFDENGSPVGSLISPTLTRWAPGQPNNVANADGLLLRSDYFWEMAPLEARHGYIFEFHTSDPRLIDTDGDGRSDFDERRFASDPNVKDSFTGVPMLPNPVGNVPFLSIGSTYYHLLQDEEGRYLGIMTVKLSTKGAFTYKFKGLNDKIKASGRGAFSGTGAYSGPGPKGLSDVTSLDMQMVQESGIWKMVAVMTRNNDKQLGSEGLPPKYGKSNPYPAPGRLTMALPLAGPAAAGVTEPSGEGVATGKIGRDGKVRANYILPNGERSTSSGPILGNDDHAVHAWSSKGRKSALVGAMDMVSARPTLDYGGTLRLYAVATTVNGQATTAIDQVHLVEGSVYTPPSKGLAPLSYLSLAYWNISFNMLEGAFDGVSKVSAWGANNKIVIPPSPTTASKAAYNPKTGLMTFGHTETDPILNTSTTANGYAVVLQRPDQTRGYYLTSLSSGRLSVTENDGSAPPLTMIAPVAKTVPVGASVYNVQVSAPGAWQVVLPEDPWVSVEIVQGGTEGLNGNGNGIVRITVQENPTIPRIWRYLTIEIAGIKHNITQDYMQRR